MTGFISGSLSQNGEGNVEAFINRIYYDIHAESQALRDKFIKEIDAWEEVNSKENPSSFITATRMRSIVEEYYNRLYGTMEGNNHNNNPSVSHE